MSLFNLLLIIFIFLHTFTCSSTLGEILKRERRFSPVAKRLYTLAQEHSDQQEATTRKHAPLPPLIMAPFTPSKFSSPIKREREAILEFSLYTHSRLPTVDSPKVHMTPLNPSTILTAAFTSIKVGPHAPHFKSYTFFSDDPENPEKGQMVLQTPIELTRKDAKGRMNSERMKIGKAPIGPDGKAINLHHLFQEDGICFEVSRRTHLHKRFHNSFHPRLSQRSSKINRHRFRLFREAYWKRRILDLEAPSKKSVRKGLFD
jgi:hypothetical protein